jgi:hypothetical protein
MVTYFMTDQVPDEYSGVEVMNPNVFEGQAGDKNEYSS